MARPTNGKEIKTFDVDGHVGLGCEIVTHSNPQSFVWVTACTNEVQNCRVSAAQNTDIVPENPDVVSHHCSRELDARSEPLRVSTARGDSKRGFQRLDEEVPSCQKTDKMSLLKILETFSPLDKDQTLFRSASPYLFVT